MIEQVMIFALGFLVAGVVALAIAPAFWQRTIRLSTRRLAMQLPLSLEEVLAGRELLRAEFAVEQRRLEQKVEALNRVHAEDMTRLGRQAVIIEAKTADLLATSQQGSDRGAEVAALKRALTETSAELAATAKEFYDVSGLVSRKDVKINEVAAALREAEALAAKQRRPWRRLRAIGRWRSKRSPRKPRRSRGSKGRLQSCSFNIRPIW